MGEKHFLFICSQNRLRSPTAEQIFADWPGVEAFSAGTTHDAENPLTDELVQWADIVVVMERTHCNKLRRKHRKALVQTRVICLDIPDEYEFIDPGLVRLLKARMLRHLPAHPLAGD
ncbi:MAG: low molecular weight protein tyrosine phosphatase family protein [Candidatus Andeanibacterium colombiense]|uniref:Low molecular weight protein tyrosine phosphatase family protein n=1 Tax=Candidatus Andeanibacterium colombiense TaxID=3121345 RepID=A0AAJ5X5R2_9SPHN|nr:MAG: low molecular weight protein tyrosine phosphatase family protein [Sphingomonadaceae bacterium]